MNRNRLPDGLCRTVLREGVRPTRFVLVISIAEQRMALYERERELDREPADEPGGGKQAGRRFPAYGFREQFRVSTSRFGAGQEMHSNRTPLGLHRIARKVGGGYPIGTVFKSRRPIGFTWEGQLRPEIVHRILWLEGLEPGRNRGGNVDTFARYVYIHGFGDETTLGRPQSRGCVHLSASDLLPLYDRLPAGTLVWIAER